MIGLYLSEEDFEYDIYSLIQAFYPNEIISRKELDKAELLIRVLYKENEIIIELEEERNKDIDNSIHSIAVNRTDRKEMKNQLKHGLYLLLSRRTGKTLPWGTLTGIRPVKIPYAWIEKERTEQEIAQYMKETYLASEEKIHLSIEIAKREHNILKSIDYRDGYSLYIGIPFCPTRCLYCSFPSYPEAVWRDRMDLYVRCLEKELVFLSEIMKKKKLNTIYIGGGTPTTLTEGQMKRLLTVIRDSFDFSYNQEFTVEAGRPDSVTREKLLTLQRYGVSRISVNPQTMNQKTLDLIGRKHTVEQTREAFLLARSLGFDNINMDLIVGLPGEQRQDMEHTMQELKILKPDSITIHSLAVKRASRLKEEREQYQAYQSINSEKILEMMGQYATDMGLMPYYLYRQKNMTGNLENVGYAAPGKEGIYNILIMEEKQTIIAAGAGAYTKLVYPDGERIERIENVKAVDQYMDRIDEMIERKRYKIAELEEK